MKNVGTPGGPSEAFNDRGRLAVAEVASLGGDMAVRRFRIPGGPLRPAAALLSVIGAMPLVLRFGKPDSQTRSVDRIRNGPGIVNHPTGVVPSKNIVIPGGWPLAADGSITVPDMPLVPGRG